MSVRLGIRAGVIVKFDERAADHSFPSLSRMVHEFTKASGRGAVSGFSTQMPFGGDASRNRSISALMAPA